MAPGQQLFEEILHASWIQANLKTAREARGFRMSCGLGVRVSPHRALGAPSLRCTWWRPRYAQKNLARACVLPPPKFPGVAMESFLSKSAIKLLQVVLASAPTAKTRVFASKHAQRRTAVIALHALLRLLLVLGSALGAFRPLQGHFMPLQEARRSPHGR
jgi:hypothetical protein